MKITPMEIQQQRFKKRLYGLDESQVEVFLERVADAVEDLVRERTELMDANRVLEAEINAYRDREDAFRESVVHSRQVMEGIQENATKEAELIVSEAQMKAENIINEAHAKYTKVSEDISDLKRRRASIDIQIRGILAAHKKVLDIARGENEAQDSREEKIAIFKKA